MNYQAAAASYKQVKNHSAVDSASPHKLIEMLFDGAVERVTQAKVAMQHKNMALKGNKINGAINIINGLRESLNHDEHDASDIAANLDGLYEYITRILSRAHITNDENLLNEAMTLLSELGEAWKQISPA